MNNIIDSFQIKINNHLILVIKKYVEAVLRVALLLWTIDE